MMIPKGGGRMNGCDEKKRSEYLECGKIINTHGVRGAVKLVSYCNSPSVLAKLKNVYIADGEEYRKLTVRNASVHGEHVIAMFEEISDIDAAEHYKNSTVYARREDVPKKENEVFLSDVIGLSVIDEKSGRVYGRVSDVEEICGRTIYVIATDTGDVRLPDVREFIREIDIDRGMFVCPIPGFFDEI